MRTLFFIVPAILAISSYSGLAQADVAQPGCKCEMGASSSARGAAAACTVFGLSVVLLSRKRTRQR